MATAVGEKKAKAPEPPEKLMKALREEAELTARLAPLRAAIKAHDAETVKAGRAKLRGELKAGKAGESE